MTTTRDLVTGWVRSAFGAAAGAGDGPADADIDAVAQPLGRCAHMTVRVFASSRSVLCAKCGDSLDAFTVLNQYAHREREFRSASAVERAALAALRQRVAALTLDVADLLDQREALRASVRTGGR